MYTQEYVDFIQRNPFVIFMAVMIVISGYGLAQVIMGNVSWIWLLAAVIIAKITQVMGHNVGIHRFYTHRSFKTSKVWQYIIAFFSVFCGISPPIHYVYLHRLHHKYSDTDLDPHAPMHGKWRAILGLWIIQWQEPEAYKVPIKDCFRDPICFAATKYYYLWWALGMAMACAIDWRIAVYILAFGAVFNYFDVNLFLVYLGHSWGKAGYQNYPDAVETYNNKFAQLWTLGDGLHNNHHKWPGRYDKSEKSGEFDFTGWLIQNFIMLKK